MQSNKATGDDIWDPLLAPSAAHSRQQSPDIIILDDTHPAAKTRPPSPPVRTTHPPYTPASTRFVEVLRARGEGDLYDIAHGTDAEAKEAMNALSILFQRATAALKEQSRQAAINWSCWDQYRAFVTEVQKTGKISKSSALGQVLPEFKRLYTQLCPITS